MESRQARKERELKHFKKKAKRALKKKHFEDDNVDTRKLIKQKLEQVENDYEEQEENFEEEGNTEEYED